jgi:hypothetical protein
MRKLLEKICSLKPCCWDDWINIQSKPNLPQINIKTSANPPEKPLSAFPQEMRVTELQVLHHYITYFAYLLVFWSA